MATGHFAEFFRHLSIRYGSGDWRTGWPASLIGDLIVRAHLSIFTVFSNDGAWRWTSAAIFSAVIAE